MIYYILPTMALDFDTLHGLIETAFPDARVELQDLMGDRDHYALEITSSQFEGKSRVQQHQMVYTALEGRMGNELHALAIKTKVPNLKES